MRHLLLILPLLFLRCLGATTTVTAMTIETNGWNALVWFASLQTNASTYAYGNVNDSNWTYSTYPITLTVDRMGFDDSGNAEVHKILVRGTRTVRFNYPDNAFVDEQIKNGTNLQVRFSLDQYIATKDSNIVASMPAGVITQNGTNNAAVTGLSVTNSSTRTYGEFPVIGNDNEVHFRVITTNLFSIRVFAAHQSAAYWNLGRPVRGCTLTVTDEHSHSTNITLNNMSWDNAWGDFVANQEFIFKVDATIPPLTSGDQLTINWKAWPFDGDSTSVLDTSTLGYSMPTPCPCPITNRLDTAGTYGQAVVVVDATNGNDSTGKGCDITAFPGTPGTTWKPFLTMAHALTNLSALHWTIANRSNICNGLIYLTNGTYAWLGANPISGYGTGNVEWVTITPYPGVARASVIIDGVSGIQGIANSAFCIRNCTINQATSNMLRTMRYAWLDENDVNETGIGLVHDISLFWATRNLVRNWKPGISADTGSDAYPRMTRANDLAMPFGSGSAYEIHNFCGNRRSTTNLMDFSLVMTVSGATYPHSAYCMMNFNDMRGLCQSNTSPVFFHTGTDTNVVGATMIGNILEQWCDNGLHQMNCRIAADASTGTPVNNVIMWHNNSMGAKFNGPYNEVGTAYAERYFYSLVGNNWDDGNLKDDIWNNPPQSGARTGQWPADWGVCYYGNFFGNVGGVGSAGFTHVDNGGMPGIDGIESDAVYPVNYQQFVNPQQYVLAGSGNGFGNYRVLSSSPLVTNTVNRWVIPFDFEGANRSMIDPPGAYAAGQPRKGSGFF